MLHFFYKDKEYTIFRGAKLRDALNMIFKGKVDFKNIVVFDNYKNEMEIDGAIWNGIEITIKKKQ